ncbi:MAG: transcriptional regulator [Candidatus Cloacimonadota bacterium]|nr:MAG: transcriptional regulator [Candidatus Cloacimonadota bacterium]
MKLREVVEILDGKLLFEGVNLEIDIPCAFGSDLISDILMSTKEPTLLLTGLVNLQIIRVSDMIDLFGIVFVRGKIPPDEVIEMAKERNLPLISTKYTLFKSSGLLYNHGLRSCKI